MKFELKPSVPLLSGLLTAGLLINENRDCLLPNSLQNPHTLETDCESQLIWPCVAPLSGVQAFATQGQLPYFYSGETNPPYSGLRVAILDGRFYKDV